MRASGRLTGAIEVLTDYEARPAPLKTCLSDWGRNHRFAGSGDRAWITDLCHDVLRHKRSLSFFMGEGSPRALCLACLRFIWGWSVEDVTAAAAEEPFGPGALTNEEEQHLQSPPDLKSAARAVQGNYPDWLEEISFPDAFDLVEECRAIAARAPVDIRVNALKTDPEKALRAMEKTSAQYADYCQHALRIPATKGFARKPALEALPAYAKGWIEVQDLGSQLASLAAGDITGKQVLDYCAGGGGKSLAMAAQAQNSGQIFSYDIDARRLAPIFERMRRAGTRNIQVRSPAEGTSLEDLKERMDIVFVDAPCSGSGTWRRKPDAKWRLSLKQLAARIDQQNQVLEEAAEFVKPGGRLVYVTCSFLPSENGERIEAFLENHPEFSLSDPVAAMEEAGSLQEDAAGKLRDCAEPHGGIQLTPARTGTDGFYIACLTRQPNTK